MTDSLSKLIPQMLEEWDDMCSGYYPDRYGLYDFMVSIIPRETGIEEVLELFSGSAELGERILRHIPGTVVTAVDSDSTLLEMAKYRLNNWEGKARTVQVDLNSSDWFKNLPGEFGLVVTSFSLHHFPDKKKQEFYQGIHSLLKNGGVFLCLDIVGSNFSEFDNMCDIQLEKFRRKTEEPLLTQDRYDFWNQVGKRLNLENYLDVLMKRIKDEESEYRGVPFEQLKLLEKSGFSEVECFYRDLSFVVYGGMKE